LIPQPARWNVVRMDQSQTLIDRVWVAYRRAELKAAVDLGRLAVDEFPDRGGAWFAYACAVERTGDLRAADKAFARAARCTQDPVGLPYRCGWRAFCAMAERTARDLPQPLRAAIDEVTLVYADYAEPELLDGFDDPELFGLFMGPVRAERDQPGEISPRIHLFRRAHEHGCATVEEFRAEVRTTLLHEFGHYLGYDEEGLARLGMD
jgi:predicted Zn-dependent protease with MMP-like domain